MAGEIQKQRNVIVAMHLKCPICNKWWTLEFRDTVAKYSDIEGVYLGTHQGKEAWRVNTSKYGAGLLCGEHLAKRKAIVVTKGASARAWRDEEERQMWGRPRNQEEFAGLVSIRADDGAVLRDDQRNESTEILGRGATITKERCIAMNLEAWTKVLE